MEQKSSIDVAIHVLKGTMEQGGKPILVYSIEYPQFSGTGCNAAVIQKLNQRYKNEALRQQSYARGQLYRLAMDDYGNSVKNSYPIHNYEFDVNAVVTYNQNCIISLYFDEYEFAGGAHGNTTRTSQTWDLNTGRQILLCSMFSSDTVCIPYIINQINTQITTKMKHGEMDYFEDYKGLVKETFNPGHFYLTPEGIVIYFQQYDVAPYVAGIPTFIVKSDKK